MLLLQSEQTSQDPWIMGILCQAIEVLAEFVFGIYELACDGPYVVGALTRDRRAWLTWWVRLLVPRTQDFTSLEKARVWTASDKFQSSGEASIWLWSQLQRRARDFQIRHVQVGEPWPVRSVKSADFCHTGFMGLED